MSSLVNLIHAEIQKHIVMEKEREFQEKIDQLKPKDDVDVECGICRVDVEASFVVTCPKCFCIQCVDCMTKQFIEKRPTMDELQDMATNHYVRCVNQQCLEKLHFDDTKINRSLVSSLSNLIHIEMQEHIVIKKERECLEKIEKLKQEHLDLMEQVANGGGGGGIEVLHNAVRERRGDEIRKVLFNILNPLTPCCRTAFEYHKERHQECEAITCPICPNNNNKKMRFCGLCLDKETVMDVSHLLPNQECPVHLHVATCRENEHFPGEFYTKAFYSQYRLYLRFEMAFNNWLADEHDDQLIDMIVQQLVPILEGTYVKFELEGGMTTREVLGKPYVTVQLPEEHKVMLNHRAERLANARARIEREQDRERERERRVNNRRRHDRRLERREEHFRPREPQPRLCGRCRQGGHNVRNCPIVRREREAAGGVAGGVVGEEGDDIAVHMNVVLGHMDVGDERHVIDLRDA